MPTPAAEDSSAFGLPVILSKQTTLINSIKSQDNSDEKKTKMTTAAG